MGSDASCDPEHMYDLGKSGKPRMVIVVFVVAVIVLASLTVLFYWQVQDYRGAKYRAQAVLVSTCIGSVNGIVQSIPGMYDESLDMENRSYFAERAHETLWDLEEASTAIMYMYNNGSSQREAFQSLQEAAWSMTIAIKTLANEMWANVSSGSAYFENATAKANALLTVPYFTEIGQLLMNGTDPQRDWTKNPYSLVNRMDLGAIKLASDRIADLASRIQPYH